MAEIHDVAMRGFVEARTGQDRLIRQAWDEAKVGREKRDIEQDVMEKISLSDNVVKDAVQEEVPAQEEGWDMCPPLPEELKVVEEDGWQVVTEVQV